jgi:putative ABC transport system permease protein
VTHMLDRKLLRDLWNLRSQVLTVGLLLGAGVAGVIGSLGTWQSLASAQERHYRANRFADVFAEVNRAPRSLLPAIAELPGVAAVEARVAGDLRIDWPASPTPVAGRVLALPAAWGQPVLNRLTLVQGRWPDPGRADEAILHVAFAEAWGLRPGATISAVLNGRHARFEIVGIAHSPEFVFPARPGSPLPDDRGFAVLWAAGAGIAQAFDMQGAFNQVAIGLAPGAAEAPVIDALDRLLDDYGALGAHGRYDQPSHRFLADELAEQRTMALIVPVIFFAVAAFLLNIVLGRLIMAQREQVAALHALGYPRAPIGAHYAKFAAAVCLLGLVIGLAGGVWLGTAMLASYRPFFRFPDLPWVLPPWIPLIAAGACLASALAGVAGGVARVLRLPPAVGMRPPAPAGFGGRWLVRLRWRPRTALAVRGLLGQPVRTLLTVGGIAFAMPMVVLGLFWWDALDDMVSIQFDRIERGDALVTFTHAVPAAAVRELAGLPGVVMAEGQRIAPVRLRAGHRSRRLGLVGLPQGAMLRVPRDATMAAVPMPQEGVALSRRLADRLGVGVGDHVRVEVLEGARRQRSVAVAALVDDIIGLNAFMDAGALNRLLGEADLVSHAVLRLDPERSAALWPALTARPFVAATAVKSGSLRIFDETVAGLVRVGATVFTTFGIIIAIGMVYSSARVSLQERAWELASLRVLGFTRAEVSGVLLMELAVALAAGIPLGVPLAQGMVSLVVGMRDNETFDLPAMVRTSTFATAALVVTAAAALSVLAVHRRVTRLDLVAALKARE